MPIGDWQPGQVGPDADRSDDYAKNQLEWRTRGKGSRKVLTARSPMGANATCPLHDLHFTLNGSQSLYRSLSDSIESRVLNARPSDSAAVALR